MLGSMACPYKTHPMRAMRLGSSYVCHLCFGQQAVWVAFPGLARRCSLLLQRTIKIGDETAGQMHDFDVNMHIISANMDCVRNYSSGQTQKTLSG